MPVCGEAVEHNFPTAFNGGTNFIMTTLHCLIGGMDSMGACQLLLLTSVV